MGIIYVLFSRLQGQTLKSLTTMTHTIKLNATGRGTLLNVIPQNSELRNKIGDSGIMDEIELSNDELAALRGYAEIVGRGKDTHWANARSQIISESQKITH